MRTMTVKCDVCGETVEKFNGAVTLASFGTLHKDACSPKCLCALLRGFAADIEKREGMKEADNIAFAAQHPEATGIVGRLPPPAPPVKPESVLLESDKPETPGPNPVGCAACDAGTPVNAETAFKHTGEGAACKGIRQGQSPCACPPSNWKMTPPDSTTPGPRDVSCQKCGNCWTSEIRDPGASATTPLGKRKGRPPGSRNRNPEPTSNGTIANGHAANASVPETPESKAQRDESMGRAPETGHSNEMERLKTQREREQEAANVGALRGPGSVFSPESPVVRLDVPGENLSQLVTDAAKLGVNLNLTDVAKWTSMQKDLLRTWIAHHEFDRPAFLEVESSPPMPPLPPPPAAPETTAKSRFTF